MLKMTVEGGVFVSVTTKEKKDGSGTYKILKVGDPLEYDSLELFCDDKFKVNGAEPGQEVVIIGEIKQQGFNIRTIAKEII